ncbi:MAG: hypothetical protein OEZ02_14915 [Anaerolineae bacterium]|nr:hypothetical protein [Anaerolineae bacterium]
MDAFDFKEEKPKIQIDFPGLFWNLATLYFLISSAGIILVFGMIFINPAHNLNPWPPRPATLPVLAATAAPLPTYTATPTMIVAPSQTPEPEFQSATETPAGQATTDATAVLEETATITPTAASGGMPFAVQPGNPIYMQSTIFYPENNCDMMAIFGQVFNLQNQSVVSQGVRLIGVLGGNTIDMQEYTEIGTAYGSGAYYEFDLGDHPIASSGALQIQLLTQEGGPLTNRIKVDTFNDCTQNLILINFVEVQ